MPRLSRCAGVLLVLLAAGIAPAADAPSEIELQKALDQPITLSLQDVPLSEAFKQIAAVAKIPIRVDPECYDLLPYGEKTLASVVFRQSRLRDGLEVLLGPVGLQTTVAGNVVLIRPTEPLRRIGHRAEWEELKLLKDLWSSSDLKAPASGPLSLSDAIRAAMESRKDLVVPIAGEANGALSPAQEQAMAQVGKQLPMSAYRALDMYCQLTGNIWFVEAGPLAGGSTGGKIMIMSRKAWIGRQLQKPIQISRNNEPLETVVADLTRVSGISFVPEPGLYQAVPVVTLRSDNGTVQQTLEALAGATRIAFDIREDSILLHMSPGPGAASRSDTIVGRISVPVGPGGMLMDVFIRESDLTPEQNELRKKRVDEALQALQKQGQAPPPASAPASQPG